MQDSTLGYDHVLAISERVGFRLDEVLGRDQALDFTRPFLPERLARVGELDYLSASEKLALNHIRAHGYLSMFGLVEEFILPFVLDHVRPRLEQVDARTRALLQFAGEEAKHIELFKRFCTSFERDFGSRCESVGPAREIAQAVLSHTPFAVALAILHIEWMTQGHYLESVKSDQLLDARFKSLLKNHFLEECQHAKLDTLIASELAQQLTPEAIEGGVDEYFAIVAALDGLLVQQVALDLASFERACSRTLSPEQRARFSESQLAACRFTFLGSGMSHRSFVATLGSFSQRGAELLEVAARRFS